MNDEERISQLMHEMLDKQEPGVCFEEIWCKSQKAHCKKKKLKWQRTLLAAAFFILVIIGSVIGEETGIKVDTVNNYHFVDDELLKGNWAVVGYVKKKEDFNPDQVEQEPATSIQAILFEDYGKIVTLVTTGIEQRTYAISFKDKWSKGYVIVPEERIKDAYSIEEVKGQQYLFLESKNNAYIMGKEKQLYYYVLKRAKLNEAQQLAIKNEGVRVNTDNTDIPFESVPEMIGTWKMVDCVDEIEHFDKDNPSRLFLDDNCFKYIVICRDGQVEVVKRDKSSAYVNWSGYCIINKQEQTVSKCEIKTIGGKQYIFLAWKNGDYIYRNEKPYYYVLEKV